MRIVLIGFMGSGKTTVAKLLAKKLRLKTIDMDDLALKKSGRKSINEIFEKDGEQKFRKIEYEVAKDISNEDKVVISTGGGVVMDKSTMNYLTKNSSVVYLKTGFDKIKKQVMLKKIRPPLFKSIVSAKKLLQAREPLYENFANIVITTDNKSVRSIVKEIIYGRK
ncbi:hypothetical protein A3B42_01730 [Candidatus Daviesbacteria bacterium RIFCSPLOWO2_01_FULL_38_10]|nr:MAG: hypothetical protein A3D02_01305 [Candidatus Daviesbacteria bacterium RIFCSPHIGHO2_02_FULL_39_41]OGE28527.1 MAG: hypothetical protein A2772_00850 [Candidatus Daviesbacteria bacterium RIFCSPHIGHO2_01_FULL_38_8b]OGE40392.1 MAG: hypothetical protein A3B42_01730 [Candidatus Daviesbacteria bacterium RIFCSPLOWO2_01_FULL_38_10]OGE44539.1 MAG: hypothetical protein A3E67_02195 [Candidatus Daviesbacteria bacterium RIFCSPHIGHO2_12_FULL_38_25]OGE68310.1 MAG: hypothetical protein A3H81_01400 [Candid